MGNATKEKKVQPRPKNPELRADVSLCGTAEVHAQGETTHAHCGQACGERWAPLCQPLNNDRVEQVGFLQGLVLISQLFIWEGGHEDEAGGSHRWPSIYYEEPDVTDPVPRDQTRKVSLLLNSL